jgi:isoquinoline 1-oxidoreductase beta subunit
MTFSAMKAWLGVDGKPLAYQHKVISPSIGDSDSDKYDKTKPDGYMLEALNDQKYEIPNMKHPYVCRTSYTHGSMACGNQYYTFFSHECFPDECAVKAGKTSLSCKKY